MARCGAHRAQSRAVSGTHVTDATPRYVLSIRKAGLGDRLASLAAAWTFARNTGRTLVVDWRYGAYGAGATNLFPRCFHTPAALAGVPLIADDTVGRLPLPRPRHPAHWEDDDLLLLPSRRPAHTIGGDRDAAVALIRSSRDVPAATVVFDGSVSEGVTHAGDMRTLFASLTPTPAAARARECFRADHFGGASIIGLHVRHGNGGDIMNHACYWCSFDEAIVRCIRAVDMARRYAGAAARVFLSTDSPQVEDAMRSTWDDVICRPKRYRPAGAGELHLGEASNSTVEDALVDMLLLADCDVLIRYPPYSFFSLYGAIMKRPSHGAVLTMADLSRSCDLADPLSPALVA
jgi:hypothetical protein